MNIFSFPLTGKFSKFYLQADLIISQFRSDIGYLIGVTSSHLRCSIKKVVLKKFAIFTGKHLCWSSLFNTKRLQDRCFPVNIAKFLRALMLKNLRERLILRSM